MCYQNIFHLLNIFIPIGSFVPSLKNNWIGWTGPTFRVMQLLIPVATCCIWLFLNRKRYYFQDKPENSNVEKIIIKSPNRHGGKINKNRLSAKKKNWE